jgi:hypothetical protein
MTYGKKLYPKLYYFFELIPEGVIIAVLTFVVTLIGKYIMDGFLNQRVQSVKATTLELMAQFNEKNNQMLREHFEKIEGRTAQNMVEVTKLELADQKILEDLAYLKGSLDRGLTKLADHDKRIMKLEHRRN